MEVSTAIFDAVPMVVLLGMAFSCLSVVAMSLVVSGFKALLRMVGR